MFLYAFDVLELNGQDLRREPVEAVMFAVHGDRDPGRFAALTFVGAVVLEVF